MIDQTVIERLQHLGMPGYEAKAYLALIGAGEPLNGYEVAKRSGVPRSTVYETLGKLVSRGAAFEVRGENNVVAYLPLPPKALLDRMGREYDESFEALRGVLPQIAAPPQVHLIHNLTGAGAMRERARDVIDGARRDLFLSLWPEEYAPLHPLVERADRRGVDISVMSFGPDEAPVGHTYLHEFSPPEVVLENLGCRLFVVVADRQQAVIGGFVNGDAWGVYTDNPAVVLLAVEYVRHDIALHLIAKHFEADEVARFWSADPEISRLRSDRGAPAAALRAGEAALRTGETATRARTGATKAKRTGAPSAAEKRASAPGATEKRTGGAERRRRTR
jgi:sugar-specific transcriptional regulator TrmB